MTTRSWVEERHGPSAPAAILATMATASLALLAALSLDRTPPRPSVHRPPLLRIVAAEPHPVAPPPPALPKARILVRPPAVTLPEPAIRVVAVPLRRRSDASSPAATGAASLTPPARHAAFRPLAAAPAAAPAAAAASPDAVRTLEGEIRAAVQEALRYPASSRMMGEEGRSLVGFDYRDRLVSNIRLLASSGTGRLDGAAIETVRDAVYPPPGAAAGRTLSLAVWVAFRIDGV